MTIYRKKMQRLDLSSMCLAVGDDHKGARGFGKRGGASAEIDSYSPW